MKDLLGWLELRMGETRVLSKGEMGSAQLRCYRKDGHFFGFLTNTQTEPKINMVGSAPEFC